MAKDVSDDAIKEASQSAFKSLQPICGSDGKDVNEQEYKAACSEAMDDLIALKVR